ncbi:MAG: hypothetical protein ABIR19_11570 [Ginsengibacter sp.]
MIRNDNELHSGENDSSESMLLFASFRTIVKRWWLFLLIALTGGLAGYIYAANQKPLYESYLSFALDEGGSQGGNGGAFSLAAQFGISLGGAQDVFTGDNILEIMQSRRMIEDALLSVDTFENRPSTLMEYYLHHDVLNDQKNAANFHYYPGESKSQFSYSKDSLLYQTYLKFRNKYILARRPDKRLNIYELMVTTASEEFSKVFTDNLINVTNRFYTEISSKKARETMEILEKRVPEMKGKLDATISNKASVQDANLNTAFARADVPLLKAQSNTQVYGAAYAEMFKNLEMARFQYLKSIPLMQVIDDADYPMKKIITGKIKTAVIFAIAAVFFALLIFIIGFVLKHRSS